MYIYYIRDSEYDKASLATIYMHTASIELPPQVIAFGYYSRLFVSVELEWKIGARSCVTMQLVAGIILCIRYR